MTRPRLTYFDAPMSRGEECRLALQLAGVDFEDHRIRREDWPAMKETTPYGALPVLDLPGHPPLAQTNAILVLIGRRQGWFMRNGFYALVLVYAGQRFLWEFLKPYGSVVGPFNLFHLVCAGLVAYAAVMIRRSHERATA